MLKIRRPLGRLIFNMGIAIPGKTVFLIETAPRSLRIVGLQLYISLFVLYTRNSPGTDNYLYITHTDNISHITYEGTISDSKCANTR